MHIIRVAPGWAQTELIKQTDNPIKERFIC